MIHLPRASLRCGLAALILTLEPASPNQLLRSAKSVPVVKEKISTLRRLIEAQPESPTAETAHEQLVTLLAGSNRPEEALSEYRRTQPDLASEGSIDFRLFDFMLKAGQFTEILNLTDPSLHREPDFFRDRQLMEIRTQAYLAQAQYRAGRECVDAWLKAYAGMATPDSRYDFEVRNVRRLRQHLRLLERRHGSHGKGLFTTLVPESLRLWGRRHEVPIVFFKLIPAHTGGAPNEAVLPGRHEAEPFFQDRIGEINRGFDYLSGGRFSLKFSGLNTLYVASGDLDPSESGSSLINSRVYVHTLPAVYRLVGEAFVVLVDYRACAEDEAAYMGDGIIHLSAAKLTPMILMHEILHGLGATHQDWQSLTREGHQFDPEDLGLMTFEKGELRYLGLEEKNRVLLDWPRVSVVRLGSDQARIRSDLPPSL